MKVSVAELWRCGYMFAHTSIGLFKALEEGASVLIDGNNLPGKQSEIYLHMSNM